MILEIFGAWIGWCVWRETHDNPGIQRKVASQAACRAQEAERRSARENRMISRDARVARLQAQTDMLNEVEGALNDVHSASRDGLARVNRGKRIRQAAEEPVKK